MENKRIDNSLTIGITTDQKEKLYAKCRKERLTVAGTVRNLIQQFLDSKVKVEVEQ